MAATEIFTTTIFTNANLKEYLRFEGSSGATIGNSGSDTNMSYNAAYGLFGQGAYFNGSAYITLNNANYKPAGDFTFMIRFKTGTAGGTIFQSYYNTSQPSGWSCELEGNKIKIVQGNVTNFINENGGADITDNAWHLLICVFTSSDNKTRVYLDGSLSWTTSAQAIVFQGSTNASIGHRSNTGGDDGVKFTGYMDDFAFLHVALDATTISDFYAGNLVASSGDSTGMMTVGVAH